MKFSTFIISTIVVLIIGIALLIYAKLFNVYSFLSLGLPLTSLVVGIGYVNYLTARETREVDNKKSFDYCWKKVNESLSRMTGADTISWEGGFGRKSDTRVISDGQTSKEFMSFYAYSSRNKQTIVLIWNITDERIARYNADPGRNVLDDPFYDFKPFQKNEVSDFDRMRRYGVQPYRNTRINVGRPREDFNTGGFVDAALRGEGTDEKGDK